MLREGEAMKTGHELAWSQVIMAANTPMLLKASMVDGRADLGLMTSGQVVGLIEDLPSVEELISRIVHRGRRGAGAAGTGSQRASGARSNGRRLTSSVLSGARLNAGAPVPMTERDLSARRLVHCADGRREVLAFAAACVPPGTPRRAVQGRDPDQRCCRAITAGFRPA